MPKFSTANGISEELLQELETALSAEGPGQQVSPPHTVPSSRIEEIPFSELQLGPVIGTGSSKTIHHSQWRGQDVAILVLHSRDAAAELAVFERLTRRPGLTCLFGVSRDSKGRQMLVTEFAPMGSLNKVLADLEDDGRSASDLVLMKCAMQVCDGMLQLVEEGLIHRDLTLRNVLVFGFDPENHQQVQVKITDYGLTRERLYYHGGSEALPIRWMPPEALQMWKWSEESDVWAFGVVMWELWSAAQVPYALVGSDGEVARQVCSGRRLERPDGCPDGVFELMRRCWEKRAAWRPSFSELRGELQNIYERLAGTPSSFTPQRGEGRGSECRICYDAAACMALFPCRHMCACEGCAGRVLQCPICRAAVADRVRIFLAKPGAGLGGEEDRWISCGPCKRILQCEAVMGLGLSVYMRSSEFETLGCE
mmetsp:Transcript_15399/g.36603  ORF Transcript_15399/g.36603 Transcript_15399/m.36603 type:complete len:425 (+) Transcript_15399:1997-3271(+)